MNIISKVAGVVLAAAALAGIGAGVASAATPTPAAHHASAISSPPVGVYYSQDFSKYYNLVISGYSDANAFTEASPIGYTIHSGESQTFDLNTTGKSVATGTVTYTVMSTNGYIVGGFDETMNWLDDGTPTGHEAVTVKNVNLPGNAKVFAGVDTMNLLDANQ